MAAFGQSNEGDVSPNTKGAHCLDTGKPCEFNHSTCNGKVSWEFLWHYAQIFLHLARLDFIVDQTREDIINLVRSRE